MFKDYGASSPRRSSSVVDVDPLTKSHPPTTKAPCSSAATAQPKRAWRSGGPSMKAHFLDGPETSKSSVVAKALSGSACPPITETTSRPRSLRAQHRERGVCKRGPVVKCIVFKSKISVVCKESPSSSWPPNTSTLPFSRTIAAQPILGSSIFGPGVKDIVARSNSSVVAVASHSGPPLPGPTCSNTPSPPPMTRTVFSSLRRTAAQAILGDGRLGPGLKSQGFVAASSRDMISVVASVRLLNPPITIKFSASTRTAAWS
mmetsp:Transcript_6518/g.20988  ORF Transcript_6518/g.20988 Transcript_6518/m.20988 type:complete len:260 (-) Transcript_6518:466-1245(-)